MINLVNCKNVLLDGPTFQNSPAWNIHPLLCENVIIRNIKVRNPWYSQNGDGLDLESCKNVVVYNSSFDVGDDAICLKSGRNEYGRRRGKPSENIVIDNCTVYHGHGGFTIGSEMSGGIRNISVKKCTFLGTDVGLRFKSTRGRGGIVENIFIENIIMKDIPAEAIRFNMFYDNREPIPENGNKGLVALSDRPAVKVSEETPQFRKIYIKNISCINARQAVFLQGLPEMYLKDVNLTDVFIKSEIGLTCIDSDKITLSNVQIITESNPVFSFVNGRNIFIEKLNVPDESGAFISIIGRKSENIEIVDSEDNIHIDNIILGDDVLKNVLKLNQCKTHPANFDQR